MREGSWLGKLFGGAKESEVKPPQLAEKREDEPISREKILASSREEVEALFKDKMLNELARRFNIPREKLEDPAQYHTEAFEVDYHPDNPYYHDYSQGTRYVMKFDGHTVELNPCECDECRPMTPGNKFQLAKIDGKLLGHKESKPWEEMITNLSKLKIKERFDYEVDELTKRARDPNHGRFGS